MSGSPIKLIMENQKTIIFLLVLCGLLGLFSYLQLPKQANPMAINEEAIIKVYYPGASAQEVEKLITGKIEEELMGIEGYDYSYSLSQKDVALINFRLKDTVGIDDKWQELRARIDNIEGSLPSNIQLSLEKENPKKADFILSIYTINNRYDQLFDDVKYIKKELASISGVSRLDIIGEQIQEIRVQVDQYKLNRYKDLSIKDLINILQMSNVGIPKGAINANGVEVTINTSKVLNNLDDIANTIIYVSEESSGTVRLKDVAHITLEPKDTNEIVKHNGENALLLAGYFQEDKDIVNIGQEIVHRLELIKSNLSSETKIEQIISKAQDVKKEMQNTSYCLLGAFFLIVLLLFLSLGIGSGLIVSVVIALTISSTLFIMKLLGIGINLFSLGGLIIALAISVYNPLVILGAIITRINHKEDFYLACLKGTKESTNSAFFYTATIILTVIPLLFSDAFKGFSLTNLFQVIVIALTSSFFISILAILSMGPIFLQQSGGVRWEKKTLYLGVFAILIVLSGFQVLNLNTGIFPAKDNIVLIGIQAEQELSLHEKENMVEAITNILREQQGINFFTAIINRELPKLSYSINKEYTSSGFAQVLVGLDTILVEELRNTLERSIVEGRVDVKLLEQGNPQGPPIQIRITGPKDQLLEVAEETKKVLKNIPGTFNVKDDGSINRYEYFLDIDYQKAAFLGISPQDISEQINFATQGVRATTLVQGNQEYDISVKSEFASIEEIINLPIISSATDKRVMLKQIANLTLKPQVPFIKKYNGQHTITVYCDLQGGTSSQNVERLVKEELARKDLSNFQIQITGEMQWSKARVQNIMSLSIAALILLYILLLIKFNSFLKPLFVLSLIVLAAVGAIIGLSLFNQALSIMAILGIFIVGGMTVNNSLLQMDFINSEDQDHLKLKIIVLAIGGTILGLLPLALWGNDLFKPMIIALIGGLIIGSIEVMIITVTNYNRLIQKGIIDKENENLNL